MTSWLSFCRAFEPIPESSRFSATDRSEMRCATVEAGSKSSFLEDEAATVGGAQGL